MIVLLATIVSFLWGLQIVLQKIMLKSLSPITTLVIGSTFYLTALAVFATWNWNVIREDVFVNCRIDAKVIAIAFISSFLCGFIANMMYMFVLAKNNSHIVAALTNTTPLFTLLFAALLLREHITRRSVMGVILIVAGTILLSYN